MIIPDMIGQYNDPYPLFALAPATPIEPYRK